MALEHTDVEVGIADERDVEEVLGLWGAARSRYSSTPDTLAEDHRRQGIGLALVRAGERRLWQCGARRVTALVGAEDEDATALWRAADYEHDRLVSRFVKNLE